MKHCFKKGGFSSDRHSFCAPLKRRFKRGGVSVSVCPSVRYVCPSVLRSVSATVCSYNRSINQTVESLCFFFLLGVDDTERLWALYPKLWMSHSPLLSFSLICGVLFNLLPPLVFNSVYISFIFILPLHLAHALAGAPPCERPIVMAVDKSLEWKSVVFRILKHELQWRSLLQGEHVLYSMRTCSLLTSPIRFHRARLLVR